MDQSKITFKKNLVWKIQKQTKKYYTTFQKLGKSKMELSKENSNYVK